MIEKAQAVATLSEHELSVLLAAIGGLWASLLAACGLLWKIGSGWVATVNAKIQALETELAKVPKWILDALEDHEQRDVRRHDEQMAAIARHADKVTEPLTRVQMDVELLTQRISMVEDTDRPPKRRAR